MLLNAERLLCRSFKRVPPGEVGYMPRMSGVKKKSENDAENKPFSLGSELALCGIYLVVL